MDTTVKKGLLYEMKNGFPINLTEEEYKAREKEIRSKSRLDGLQELLGMTRRPYRIEAYDISNISGFESVGSMVVYEKGKPKRSDYRKFKIKWVQGPNDYG